MDFSSFNYISLCAGAGGLDLAVRIVFPKARCLCYVEREIYPAAILASHMESGAVDAAPIWSNLATFSGTMFRGRVDLVVSGIPCQPYSVAGKQLGHSDERALWPELCRVVGEIRPAIVFIENVPPFLNEFRPVGNRLQEMGYRIEEPLFLTAAECGAPHRRERVFILAHTGRERDERWRVDGNLRSAQTEEHREAYQWKRNEHAPSDGGAELAHPSRGGLGELRQSPRSNGQPDGSNEPLEDTPRDGERGLDRQERRLGRRGVREASNELADAGNGQLPQSERRSDRRTRVRSGEDVANPRLASRRRSQKSPDIDRAGAPSDDSRASGAMDDAASPRRNDEGQHRGRPSLSGTRSVEPVRELAHSTDERFQGGGAR